MVEQLIFYVSQFDIRLYISIVQFLSIVFHFVCTLICISDMINILCKPIAVSFPQA